MESDQQHRVLDAPVPVEDERRDRQPGGSGGPAGETRSREEHQQRDRKEYEEKFAAGEQQTWGPRN